MDKLIKTPEEIEIMAEGGHILALILKEVAFSSHIGVSTKSLDILVNSFVKAMMLFQVV